MPSMNSFLALALAVSSLVTTATPVSAKTTQATELLPRWKARVARDDQKRLDLLLYFTDCVARKQRPLALMLLASVPGSEEHDKVLERLTWNATCFPGGRFEMYMHELRGGVAEALMRSLAPDLRAISALPATPEDFAALKASHDRARGRRMDKDDIELLRTYWVARCVVRRNAIQVRSLLATQPGSALELQRLQALSGPLAACNGAERKLDVSRHQMRNFLAEALYALAVTEARVSS